MNLLTGRLDRAGGALRRSLETVRGSATLPSPPMGRSMPTPGEAAPVRSHITPANLRPAHKDSAMDQSIAALHAVVWIASFVQSIFNEIRGRSDDF